MYRCSKCSHSQPKWAGKCPSCGEWNCLVETPDEPKTGKGSTAAASGGTPLAVTSIKTEASEASVRIPVASAELSNLLGGGMVPGSLILLSGEPGIGKSTLSIQLADWFAKDGRTALYVSAEENAGQISDRALRLGIKNADIRLLTASVIEDVFATLDTDSSSLVILDSVSVFGSRGFSGGAGSVALVRSVAETAMEYAKRTGKTVVLIGHVTKDGAISGPKALEHLVDTVLFLEGSRYEDYRILRSLKNRFGATDEVALFRMTETGLQDLSNPGLEFSDSKNAALAGSALTVTMEGSRPIVVEIEALTTYTKFGYPKRSSRGIPQGKLELLLAVLSKWTDVKTDSHDVYLNVARGLTLSEPGIDLAAIAAIASSRQNAPL